LGHLSVGLLRRHGVLDMIISFLKFFNIALSLKRPHNSKNATKALCIKNEFFYSTKKDQKLII